MFYIHALAKVKIKKEFSQSLGNLPGCNSLHIKPLAMGIFGMLSEVCQTLEHDLALVPLTVTFFYRSLSENSM